MINPGCSSSSASKLVKSVRLFVTNVCSSLRILAIKLPVFTFVEAKKAHVVATVAHLARHRLLGQFHVSLRFSTPFHRISVNAHGTVDFDGRSLERVVFYQSRRFSTDEA